VNSPSNWFAMPARPPHAAAEAAARLRQQVLTKPPGSLGRLEAVAIRLAALQGRERPRVDRVHVAVFAADHGVAAEGVSAFPQAVTAEMVKNFARGGAAISVLSRSLGARLEVIDLGTVGEVGDDARVTRVHLGPGTANLARTAAMSEAQLFQALDAGRASVARAGDDGAELYIGGEMGIANTTAATALCCALLGAAPQELAGPGTGLDGEGLARKIGVIGLALELHRAHLDDPLQVLRRLGGFEIAALAGAYIACAQRGLPVLVDGFIAGAAALVASRLCPEAGRWMLFSHRSAEPGHGRILAALDAEPLLALELRLGEGSGAAVAVPLLRLACDLHHGMATFAEAGIPAKL
jgi:nicotinate-nucleotide--dimethylbenzimidazole phosphoribosyltransferase